ncbi:hypothetical protein QOZ80_6BG0479720 [Eleusine coracana subsp. coracana]|nr:hypothetical protein QOZ80_6BG0479720 [Eleusine coracana subsp. coracana]
MHFINLHVDGNLSEILDPRVKVERGKEVEEVATLAVSCIKMTSDDRPTMRQVEHILEGLQASIKCIKGNITEVVEFEEKEKMLTERRSTKEMSRRYSMEQEFLMSARYPR